MRFTLVVELLWKEGREGTETRREIQIFWVLGILSLAVSSNVRPPPSPLFFLSTLFRLLPPLRVPPFYLVLLLDLSSSFSSSPRFLEVFSPPASRLSRYSSTYSLTPINED